MTPLLRSGKIEASFGDFTVDLSGCEAVQDNCPLTVETNFGSLTLLVPDRFAVTVSGKDTTAASLDQRGTPCEHPEAQILLDARSQLRQPRDQVHINTGTASLCEAVPL